MSKSQRLNSILDRAKGKEKEYEWFEAAELFAQALREIGKKDFLRKGEIQEKIGHCFYRAAFQAGSQEEFQKRIRLAVNSYKKACQFHERLVDKQKAAKMFRSEAIVKYLGYWLTSDPSEKRKLLDECLKLEDKALTGFSRLGNMLEYGRTYNELSNVSFFRIVLEWDREASRRIVERGVHWGEKSVLALSELGASYEIARAHQGLAPCLTLFFSAFVADPEEKEQHRLRVVERLREAVKTLESVGDAYLVGLCHIWLGFNMAGLESVKHYEKALECGNETRDSYLKAVGMDFLAFSTYWKATGTEDPDQRRKLAKDAMEFYDEARQHYTISSYHTPRPGLIAIPGGYAEHYYLLAEWETDPAKKLDFLQKSEKAGNEALKMAEDSGIHSIVRTMHHILSKTLIARARVEQDIDEKRSLLKKALENRKRSLEFLERWNPYNYWDMGVMHNYLAEIEAELGHLEPDVKDEKRRLEEAVSNKEICLRLIGKELPYLEEQGNVQAFGALHQYQDSFEILLNRLYELTRNREHLRKAIKISREAVESAKKVNVTSLMAGSYWKIAKIQDTLGEHLEAAESFEHASEGYKKAAEKISQLKDFYEDYACYMQAWSEIERARHHHARQEYGKAKEHYEKAATLHNALEQWSYLAPNYSAWAQVENAEDLSRMERSEEALQAFKQAAKLFSETKKSIETKHREIENLTEKTMATNLLKASDLRHEYCLGRIAIEEAKILDRKGDHYSSSQKYGSATQAFEQITQALELEQDRREFQLILTLSRAWQKMIQAEAEASPTLYSEASQLFEEAKDLSPGEKAKMLALGHSRFCRALETGARFADTVDVALHTTAVKHLESAAKYYVKAGFKTASEYARATHRLFDAYMYVHKAETELEPGRKAQYYQMAEKLLQASAGSYVKAKHPEKSEEVGRLLESVKEERQLAMSLTEVLHAPAIASSTTSFATPTPTHEQAVGLERFEHADIQANLILRVAEVKVDEDVEFQVELVNAGKAPALLIKVDEIIPEGFEIKQVPETYTFEDSYVNMKGRRLNPLKTEDVKMVVRPRSKGTFTVKPRVLYIDETGKYKSHEPEPVTITVKELGIKGWIKGER